MPSVIVTQPTAEPVTLIEAKNHLRVDDPGDDLLIGALITAARQDAESITRRQLMRAQWKMALDCFPAQSLDTASANWYGPAWGTGPGPLTMQRVNGKTGYEIYLKYPPLASVDSIKYIDQDGIQQTLAPSEYLVDTVSEPGRITPAYGKTWPGTRNQAGAVEVNFTAGYATAALVPGSIKAWILMRVGALYQNREEVAVGQRVVVLELPFVDRLLDAHRIVSF